MKKLDSLPIASTFSKDARFWGEDFHPSYLLKGEGAKVQGSDYRWYTDFVCGLGAIILGYGNVAWTARVQKQVSEGAGFSLPHFLERQVADKLVMLLGKRVKGWTPEGIQVRFGKSGSDATMMAVRLARAATSRMRVASMGYHGWLDTFVAATPPAWGIIPEEGDHIQEFAFNDLASLEKLREGEPIAAVILEQPLQEPEPGFYQGLRDFCDETGALLIMDEVVTGFRYALGGAAELYGVEPDICCYGKAMGNGLGVSCIVGRRELMQWFNRKDPVFVSSTNFGDAVGLAAADAFLDIWNEKCLARIWDMGKKLQDGLNAIGLTAVGNPPRSLLQFADGENAYSKVSGKALRAYFVAGMRDRGILMNRPNFPNLAHTDAELQQTLDAAKDMWEEMYRVDVGKAMKGKLPWVLFERR